MQETRRRSLAKAISWRVTGTVDTFLISWLITGKPLVAGGIAATEVATKIVLFYLHERAWARVRWGWPTHPASAAGAPSGAQSAVPVAVPVVVAATVAAEKR